jgi:TolB-like protein
MMDFIAQWLETHEALFSSMTALVALLGVIYGVVRTVLSSARASAAVARKTQDLAIADRAAPAGPAAETAKASSPTPGNHQPSLHDEHVSLVVLRFETLSKNEDDQFLASGIASEIIALLAPVADLRVSSRNSSYHWGSDASAVQQAAEQFNANFALTGSLMRSGERIRIISRLIDTRSKADIWTQSYDRKFEDLLEVQQEIARSIVGATLGQVRLTETLIARKTPDEYLDAWGLLQKAYHFWLANFSIEGMMQATACLRRAIELAPEYAAPHAALAMLLAQQLTTRICPDYDAVAAEAGELINRAYRLAPNDIDVLENAGVVWQNLGESERAISALRHGIELAPLNLISRGYLAMTLALTRGAAGAYEAKQLLDENFAIAPKHPSVPYWFFFKACAEQCLGNYAASVVLCTRSLRGQPGWVHNHYLLANAYAILGDMGAARRDIAAATATNPYLTAALFVENLRNITRNDVLSAPFVRGLVESGLVAAPRLAQPP